MGATKIEWCDYTFNPWRGCAKVSAGCKNCYAEKFSVRQPEVFGEWGEGGRRVIAAESTWRQPLAWDRAAAKAGERRRVFCGSLMDVFESRPELAEPRARLFELIGATPHLDWLLLTKRPENILSLNWPGAGRAKPVSPFGDFVPKPLHNVWLGVSVEDQASADMRIPELLQIPAAVRFVSYEPALGPVDFQSIKMPDGDALGPSLFNHGEGRGIDWLIYGGESGPGARPCNIEWARAARDQCRAAGIPYFCKQLGARVEGVNDGILGAGFRGRVDPWAADLYRVLSDSKGGNMAEWPEDLRVREFPA